MVSVFKAVVVAVAAHLDQQVRQVLYGEMVMIYLTMV
jgi:hypothetical protein